MAKFPNKQKNLKDNEDVKAQEDPAKENGKVDEKTRMRELREKRKAQKTLLCGYILSNLDSLPFADEAQKKAITEAATELKPGFSTVPTNRGVNARIMSLFADKEVGFELTEDEAFITVVDGSKLRAGRPEMRKFMKHAVQDVDAEKRLWVRFDGPTEKYQLVGKGAEAPEGWKGVRPTATVNVPG
ncbi:MAG: hypothetical protein OQK77_00455 [Psychromonas sp.]|nr:hypothetical protein [Psychromonas sp.]